MKRQALQATIIVEWEVTDLSNYNATTLEEAAAFEQEMVDTNVHEVEDLLSFGDCWSVTIKPVMP